jgi:transposase
MEGEYRRWAGILAESTAEWRQQQAYADGLRGDLIDLVAQAAAAGMSEYQIAAAVGVQRLTIRAWLGKGRR